MKAYTALHFIDRGKNADPSVVKPGEVFEFTGTERDRLIENNAIREATADEILLAKGRGFTGAGRPQETDTANAETLIQQKLTEANQAAATKLAEAEKAAAEKIAEAEKAVAEKIAAAEKAAAEIVAAAEKAAAPKASETATPASEEGAKDEEPEAKKGKKVTTKATKTDDDLSI